ncbi:MAG TPA: acyl-CoA synthetase [Acidimicrobiia bacterium]|nr:acyl-CoA synthetase [Acidimicrobiia bacterium]
MAGGFWEHATEDPSYLAVVDPDGAEHAAGEMVARSNQLVHGLRGLGLAPGDAIASVLPNGVTPMELLLAATQSGWYITPINYHLTGPEIAYIVDDCEAKAFFCHPRFADAGVAAMAELDFPADARFAVGGDIAGFRSIDELRAGQPTDAPEDRRPGLAMHYTSGTTGQPKGVRRELPDGDPDTSAEMNSLFLMLFGIPPKGGNVHLVTSPNYHTAVTSFGANALHAGHTVVFMDRWDAEETLAKIERYGVTHTHMVPTQFHRMLALDDDVRAKYDVSSMRWAVHAAAPCPVDVKHKMLDWWGPVIYEYYAATEGGGTLATPEQWLEHPGTVGTAWPISTLRIVDDDGNECPLGTPGTVYMKMDTVDFEYKGDQDKTEENRLEGFFTVGDIGYLTEDGYLFLCDRKSDMIISGGVNIYPAEIEGEILTHPKVADAAVFGIPDDDWGEQIKAVIELAPGVEASDGLADELLEYLRPRLGKYKWPKSIDFSDALPREPTGKLLKRKLRDPYWEGRERAI